MDASHSLGSSSVANCARDHDIDDGDIDGKVVLEIQFPCYRNKYTSPCSSLLLRKKAANEAGNS
jgi:hypothetical protein